MIVAIFRTRTVDNLPADYEEKSARMVELASAAPGFVSYKNFGAADGERVSIIEFESAEAMRAWQQHPEHMEVQKWGREHLYTEFKLQVLTPVREYSFTRPAADS